MNETNTNTNDKMETKELIARIDSVTKILRATEPNAKITIEPEWTASLPAAQVRELMEVYKQSYVTEYNGGLAILPTINDITVWIATKDEQNVPRLSPKDRLMALTNTSAAA